MGSSGWVMQDKLEIVLYLGDVFLVWYEKPCEAQCDILLKHLQHINIASVCHTTLLVLCSSVHYQMKCVFSSETREEGHGIFRLGHARKTGDVVLVWHEKRYEAQCSVILKHLQHINGASVFHVFIIFILCYQ